MSEENNRVLRQAFLNSYYQTGLKNLLPLFVFSNLMVINGKISHQEHKGTKITKKNQYDGTMYA